MLYATTFTKSDLFQLLGVLIGVPACLSVIWTFLAHFFNHKLKVRILEFYVYEFETTKKYVYKLLLTNRTRKTLYINDIKLLLNKETYNKYYDYESLQIILPPNAEETICLDFPMLPLPAQETTTKFAVYIDNKIIKMRKIKMKPVH